MRNQKPLLSLLLATMALMPWATVKSQPVQPQTASSVMLVKGVSINLPPDLQFEASGNSKDNWGAMRIQVKQGFWTAKKGDLFLHINYFFMPGQPPKDQQTVEFIEKTTLASIVRTMKEYKADFVSNETNTQKISNGSMIGYAATISAAAGSKFSVKYPAKMTGNYSCVTRANFRRQTQGILAKKIEEFTVIAASNDCESVDHKKAIAAIKSMAG